MKTATQHWAEFQAGVIPADAPTGQLHGMRQAFCAGFLAALAAIAQIPEETGDDADAGERLMSQLYEDAIQLAMTALTPRT